MWLDLAHVLQFVLQGPDFGLNGLSLILGVLLLNVEVVLSGFLLILEIILDSFVLDSLLLGQLEAVFGEESHEFIMGLQALPLRV